MKPSGYRSSFAPHPRRRRCTGLANRRSEPPSFRLGWNARCNAGLWVASARGLPRDGARSCGWCRSQVIDADSLIGWATARCFPPGGRRLRLVQSPPVEDLFQPSHLPVYTRGTVGVAAVAARAQPTGQRPSSLSQGRDTWACWGGCGSTSSPSAVVAHFELAARTQSDESFQRVVRNHAPVSSRPVQLARQFKIRQGQGGDRLGANLSRSSGDGSSFALLQFHNDRNAGHLRRVRIAAAN